MNSILELARADLRGLRPYTPGQYQPGLVRLNANESPWRSPLDTTERGLNVYPPPRPDSLRSIFAEHYGFPAEEILVTRGSSEAIDVLIRGFCHAGQDAILVTPPTFDMYRLYAGIQNARVVEVPLDPAQDFALNPAAVASAINRPVKLIFICSPNNPTGRSADPTAVEAIVRAAEGQAIVVIDEAYREFSDAPGFDQLRQRYEHVVLLRTLSKFVAMAGVRCGLLIGAPALVAFLQNVLPPYTFPTPSIELVEAAFRPEALRVAGERIAVLKSERERLRVALTASAGVSRVYTSDANFILLRSPFADELASRACAAGVLVRQFPGQAGLEDCIRVTIGKPEENDMLIAALSDRGGSL